jgi:hypothetical protein
MRERTTRHVAIRMWQRTGQIVPEHEQAAAVKARTQDAARAAEHGLVRFTACATVTTEEADVEDACAALEADAAQDAGFACGGATARPRLAEAAVIMNRSRLTVGGLPHVRGQVGLAAHPDPCIIRRRGSGAEMHQA